MPYMFKQNAKGSLKKAKGPMPPRMTSTNLPLTNKPNSYRKSDIKRQISNSFRNLSTTRKITIARNK